MQSHSLTKRYFFKLTTSIMVVPLNLLIITIISRSLGPNLYGQFRYLIYFFTLMSSFVGFGGNYLTSELAKNHNDKGLISFYQAFMLISWFVAAIILTSVIYLNGANYLFPEVSNYRIIWLAFLLAFITFISQMYETMTDACGLTKKASIYNLLSKLVGLIFLVVIIYFLKMINLYSVFSVSIASAITSLFAFGWVLISNKIGITEYLIIWSDFKNKFISFFNYSHPLLALSIVTFVFGVFTRWVLQYFGGSVEQGYFSFSDAFSGFIIIFANSIIPLLQREFSISYGNHNLGKMKLLFERSLLIFVTFATFFCVYLVYNTKMFTSLIGGHSFKGSILSTQVMLFYPIPYIANNILYATCYATSKTSLLRNVQISIGLLNSIITFFLIAPQKYGGLHLGAFGFAISLVAVTYLNHIILLIYCSKIFDLNWINLIFKYLRIIIIFIIIGAFSFIIGKTISSSPFINIFISGILYLIFAALFLLRFPVILSFTRSEVQSYITSIVRNINETKFKKGLNDL